MDDVTTYTHTLLVAAIAQTSNPTGSGVPIIRFEQPVSFTQPLYSLNVQAVAPNPADTCLACHIVMTGGASTYASQTYKAGYVEASATVVGGDVTFSVYDPNANVNFLLPSNAQGQVDLRNPNSTDGLTINGNTNFLSAPNLTGYQNWGRGVQFQDALGAVPTTSPQLAHYAQMQLNKKLLEGDSEVTLVANVEIDAIEQAPDCSIDPNQPEKVNPECKLAPNL